MVSADKVWGSLSSTGRGISYPEGVSPCQPNFLGRSLEMRDSEVAEVCDQTCSLLVKRRSVVLAAVLVRLLRLGIRSHLCWLYCGFVGGSLMDVYLRNETLCHGSVMLPRLPE